MLALPQAQVRQQVQAPVVSLLQSNLNPPPKYIHDQASKEGSGIRGNAVEVLQERWDSMGNKAGTRGIGCKIQSAIGIIEASKYIGFAQP